MATYAEIKIKTTDGKEYGTYEPVVGDIRDTVQDLMDNYFKTKEIYPSITVSKEDGTLSELAKAYRDSASLEFVARLTDVTGIDDEFKFGEININNFYDIVSNELVDIWAIDADTNGYDTAALPAWISNVWSLQGEQNILSTESAKPVDPKEVAIFKRYCELFLQGEILFGIRVSRIESIELSLT